MQYSRIEMKLFRSCPTVGPVKKTEPCQFVWKNFQCFVAIAKTYEYKYNDTTKHVTLASVHSVSNNILRPIDLGVECIGVHVGITRSHTQNIIQESGIYGRELF